VSEFIQAQNDAQRMMLDGKILPSENPMGKGAEREEEGFMVGRFCDVPGCNSGSIDSCGNPLRAALSRFPKG
jgi:hypothetical protein